MPYVSSRWRSATAMPNGREHEQEHEDVVEAQALLDQVAGEERVRVLAVAEREQHDEERQRDRDPGHAGDRGRAQAISPPAARTTAGRREQDDDGAPRGRARRSGTRETSAGCDRQRAKVSPPHARAHERRAACGAVLTMLADGILPFDLSSVGAAALLGKAGLRSFRGPWRRSALHKEREPRPRRGSRYCCDRGLARSGRARSPCSTCACCRRRPSPSASRRPSACRPWRASSWPPSTA